jgi:hypothetical protein
MKLRTNLRPEELDLVAKGLQKLAKKQAKPYLPENQAEREILRQMELALDVMGDSLQAELSTILLDD